MNLLRSAVRSLPVVFCLLVAGPASAIQTCELDGQPIDQNNGNTTAGKSGLMRCREKESGAIVREEELRNGRFMGAVRHFKNGQVEKEYRVDERGNRDGLYREWNVTAAGGRVLVKEETTRNGKTSGIARSWTPGGTLRRLTSYGDDGREQASAEFTESGKLYDLRCASKPVFGNDFDDRSACGFDGRASTVVLYGGKDQPSSRIAFERGERKRVETLWDSGAVREVRETTATGTVERSFAADGTKRHETQSVAIASSSGRPRSVRTLDQEFHETGKLIHEQRWTPGEQGADPVSDTSWYLNGQMKDQVRYVASGDRQVKRETSFHDNGKIAFEGTWVVDGSRRGRYERDDDPRDERPTGTHKTFDEQGRVRGEQVFDDRGRLTRESTFDLGVLVRDDEVFEDGSRKSVGR